jgi:hypothetical protein
VTPGTDTAAGITEADRSRLCQMQAYEDAVAYRSARLAIPCPDCGAERCDEHATDLDLITWYRQAAADCGRAISASLPALHDHEGGGGGVGSVQERAPGHPSLAAPGFPEVSPPHPHILQPLRAHPQGSGFAGA